MPYDNETIKVTVERDGETIAAESVAAGPVKVVIIINNQFTNAPNTTQIASGAGENSAAGNNAAIDSSNTLQQQSVGAQGTAKNSGQSGAQTEPHVRPGSDHVDSELVIVANQQENRTRRNRRRSREEPAPQPASAATQVASGGGTDSAAGTNAAVASSNTKQQHAVGGGAGAKAKNKGQDADQTEE